jgi:hypothetical protein
MEEVHSLSAVFLWNQYRLLSEGCLSCVLPASKDGTSDKAHRVTSGVFLQISSLLMSYDFTVLRCRGFFWGGGGFFFLL